MADESYGVDMWIGSTLAGVAAVTAEVGDRLYPGEPPPDTPVPFVVWELAGDDPLSAIAGKVVQTTQRWLIKAVDEGYSYARARRIHEAIRDRLDDAEGSNAEVDIESCRFVGTVRYPGPIEGETRSRHYGGLYEIIAVPK